jgi:phosphohistidine phosphatase
MNHTLFLMRHAKSDWNTNASSDFDRPLNKRGRKDAPAMGAWIADNTLIPELIVASPALRAKQTAIAVAGELGKDEKEIIWDQGVYGASLSDLLNVITDYYHNTQSMMLIGHCPGMDYLLEYLSQQRPDYTASGKLMTTATVAVLSFGEAVISTTENSASLTHLVRPADL